MRDKHHNMFNRKAQSIIELSLLGAVLLGVLGLLIRYSVSLSQSQETQLAAMRKALELSLSEAMSTNSLLLPAYPLETPSNKKTGNRRTATVLWVEDVPTVEGGEKYGSTSYTPTVSFASGTATNLLQYPNRNNDPSQVPYMDIYVNGKHFTFTTFDYRWKGPFSVQDQYGNWLWNTNEPNVLNPDAHYWLYDTVNYKIVPWPVFWTKISRSDKKFCYDLNDPSDHECSVFASDNDHNLDERWRLDPVNNTPVIQDIAVRKKLQWQWYPVILSDVQSFDYPNGPGDTPLKWRGMNWFDKTYDPDQDPSHAYVYSALHLASPNAEDASGGEKFLSLDVDYDGHEEYLLGADFRYRMHYGNQHVQCGVEASYYGITSGTPHNFYSFWSGPQTNANTIHCQNEFILNTHFFKLLQIWYIDYEAGDLALDYSEIDKKQGKPKPGFTQAKAKILTYSSGNLTIDQEKLQTKAPQSQNISTQTKDDISVIEREIQLSNDTGRFDPSSTGNLNYPRRYPCANPVDVACTSAPGAATSCCYSGPNALKTCFDKAPDKLILYVRTIIKTQTGHKLKTISPIHQLP